MDFHNRYSTSSQRREELIRAIDQAVSRLSLPELEALTYDLMTKGYME